MPTEKKLTGYPSIDKPWLKYYSEEAINAPLPECTIYDYLWENNKDHLDDIALSYFGREITYGELFLNINKAADVLCSMGVKENDRILYLLPNIPETAYLLYGGSKIGAVSDYIDPRPDSLDMRISAEKVLQIISDEKINHIVALDQCYLGMIQPVEAEIKEYGINQVLIVSASDSMNSQAKRFYLSELLQLNSLSDTIKALKRQKHLTKLFSNAKQGSKLSIHEYSDFVARCSSKHTPIQYHKNRLEIIVHTSGTSSPKPKPIPLTNDNLNSYAHQTFGANMPMQRGDKALHILPYFAAFGIVDVVHAGLSHGNCLIQIPEFSPQNLGKLVAKHKPQILIGAPTWLLSLFDDSVLQKQDLSFFKMLTYGGDSMEEVDENRINSFLAAHNCKIALTKGHGMSETCGCASYATGNYNKIGGIGIPMPNTIYAVVDSETKVMIPFQNDDEYIEGELVISSPAVTSGILDRNVIVPTMEYDGLKYIFTRDIAKMYRDGTMKFLSRSDRSFTRYDGYKIKPYEIENIIKKYPNVQNCIIAPYIDDKVKGNMPVCHIVTEEKVAGSYEQKRKFVENLISKVFINNPQMSSRQIPSKFSFCTSLPVSKNGKIDYRAVFDKPLDGSEITVKLEETNISLGSISIT